MWIVEPVSHDLAKRHKLRAGRVDIAYMGVFKWSEVVGLVSSASAQSAPQAEMAAS